MQHNGIELQSMTYNGKEVEMWVHNGIEVYSAFTPFYVINNGSLVDGTYTAARRITEGVYNIVNKNYGAQGYPGKDNPQVGCAITFDTNGAKKIKLKGEATILVTSKVHIKLQIYTGNTLLYDEYQGNKTLDMEFDVSEYDTISVKYINFGSGSVAYTLGAWITEIYCGK